MNARPSISLARQEHTTGFAPLVALGDYVRQLDLLSPLWSRLIFPPKTHTQSPQEALLDLWVSILAGCRSVSQINTQIRPDPLLARAWGRLRFYEQSTVARVLDSCQAEQVAQLRDGVESLYRWIGRARHHPFAQSPLLVDIDLTGLPAGRQAAGSTKGYFRGKRGPAAGSCAGWEPPPMPRA